MWQMFSRDPLYSSDRRKMRAEKKYHRDQRRKWRRMHRAEALEDFIKRWRKLRLNPFARRELTEEQLERRNIRMFIRSERRLARQKWWQKFRRNPWRAVFARKKRRAPDGGYLYVYPMTRQERKERALQKRKQLRENFRNVIYTPDLRQKFLFGYLHSSAYFILAFMFIYIIYQVITIVLASSYNIPVVWYYYRLKFPLSDFSPLYTRQALIVIFASGPVMSLMLAFAFLQLYFNGNSVARRFKLFFLWGFICGANMFFGAYIAGFLTRTEFIYTSEWLFMSHVFDIEEILFTTISLAVMLFIGRIVTPLFLLSSGSITMIRPEYRLFFIISHVVLPWMTGIVVLFLVTLPTYYLPLILKTITPGLILLPTLFQYKAARNESIHESGAIQRSTFRWSIVIFVVALLFFYRIVLSWGLRVE